MRFLALVIVLPILLAGLSVTGSQTVSFFSVAPPADTTEVDPEEALPAPSMPNRLEINGMVVDETRSKHGRDFYDLFYTSWSEPEESYAYTIRIEEKPGRGRGTIIIVRVNDEIVYQSQLQPRYEVVEQTALQAVEQTYRIMQRYDLSRRIF
jgi:hypothetical protein